MFLVNRTKPQEISLFVAYILVLFLTAVIRDFVLIPLVAQHMSGSEVVLIEPLWKLLFWITPTILYIRFVDGQNPLTYLKLTTHPLKGLFWGLYGCVFIAALLSGTILRSHGFHLPTLDTWVNVILLVGIMEEIPFRGFLFQKLQSFFGASWVGFVGATLISSLLFVLIHTPLWISTGQSIDFIGLLEIFAVAILACTALKLSGSLWSSVIIHTFYNFLASVL